MIKETIATVIFIILVIVCQIIGFFALYQVLRGAINNQPFMDVFWWVLLAIIMTKKIDFE